MAKKTFYISTAIDYVNAAPHLGHSYEKIIADVIARWSRLNEIDTYFLTGVDENAQKNAKAAKELGISTKELVDQNSEKFRNLCKSLNLSNDYFIRTTDEKHRKVAQEIFQKLYDNKDIYLSNYESLYCGSCEAFYLEKDLVDGKCPVHGKELDYLKEESYFFKLSKYEKQILELLNKKDFVIPDNKRRELINRIKKDGLKDLSVSRRTLNWGIDVPFDSNHKIYVWIDALSNYISALDYPKGELYKKYWPANVHLIGKDIVWFHAVIWPAILIAADIKIPKTILVHGFINIKGAKLSKTTGNIIDPIKLINEYGLDALRYFLIREIKFMEDGDFSEDSLKERLNNELANDLGNLVSRILTICEKNFHGNIKKYDLDQKLVEQFHLDRITELMDSYQLTDALNEIWFFVKACNKHVNEEKLWELKGDEQEKHLYNLLESIRITSLLLSPFIPKTSDKIFEQLGVKSNNIKESKFGLVKEYHVKRQGVLFNKLK